MSDRLQELRRQKALLIEQAACLDREIAAEQARINLAPPAAASQPPASADAAVEALLNQYRPDPQALRQSVKRGCYLYFLAALALLGLGVLTIYLVDHHR
jgi:flagellar biosynthesis/type III secretory pathway chaperone